MENNTRQYHASDIVYGEIIDKGKFVPYDNIKKVKKKDILYLDRKSGSFYIWNDNKYQKNIPNVDIHKKILDTPYGEDILKTHKETMNVYLSKIQLDDKFIKQINKFALKTIKSVLKNMYDTKKTKVSVDIVKMFDMLYIYPYISIIIHLYIPHENIKRKITEYFFIPNYIYHTELTIREEILYDISQTLCKFLIGLITNRNDYVIIDYQVLKKKDIDAYRCKKY